ncbi:MAG TPA: excalibur calcium-binding domain-containing protein [Pseudolabrys sp.]|nr:excalibur calcium-binding domain-containing protein [Pseudolabrys sp.]
MTAAVGAGSQRDAFEPQVVHSDVAGAERRLREIRSAFSSVSRRWDRWSGLKYFCRLIVLPAATAIGTFAIVWSFVSSPWPIALRLRHLAAFPNCHAAEMMGLAPARRGQPGYWSHLDADGDGIACE